MNEELLSVFNLIGVVLIQDQDDLNAFLDYLEENQIGCVVHPTDGGWTVSRT